RVEGAARCARRCGAGAKEGGGVGGPGARSRHEEPAVAPARPACRGARLDDRAVDAALGQVPGAGEPGDAGSDHEQIRFAIAGERCALLVRVVVPERNRGHGRIVDVRWRTTPRTLGFATDAPS